MFRTPRVWPLASQTQRRADQRQLAQIAKSLEEVSASLADAESARRRNERKRSRRDIASIRILAITALAGAFSVAVGFAQAIVLYRTLDATRTASRHQDAISSRQIDVLRQQATINRAHLWIELQPDQTRFGVSKDNHLPFTYVQYRIVNYGDTPAIIEQLMVRLYTSSNFTEDAPNPILGAIRAEHQKFVDPSSASQSQREIPSYTAVGEGGAPKVATTMLSNQVGRGQEVVIGSRLEFERGTPLFNIGSGALFIFVRYRDVYGIARATSIYVQPTTADPSQAHAEYNCWDDECPRTLTEGRIAEGPFDGPSSSAP